MDDYDWREHESEELPDRFSTPLGLAGIDAWRLGALALVSGAKQNVARWAQAIEMAPRPATPRTCPRVFVSHRQTDIVPASRIAYEASRIGFDFWLDVIDLAASKTAQVTALEHKLKRPLTHFELSVLVAAIIEMALVNCTHVIATMTIRTAGSQWVPYEYGRVLDRSVAGDVATAWWDTTTLPLSDVPDYMHLAPVHKNQAAIRRWFRSELSAYSLCATRPKTAWRGPVPPPLPTG